MFCRDGVDPEHKPVFMTHILLSKTIFFYYDAFLTVYKMFSPCPKRTQNVITVYALAPNMPGERSCSPDDLKNAIIFHQLVRQDMPPSLRKANAPAASTSRQVSLN